MRDFIFVAGAPGTGKTTICKLLSQKLVSPYVEFSYFRQMHLDETWSNATPLEEQMAFENLLFTLKNYSHYGYKNVIVTDFEDERVQQLPGLFPKSDYLIVTLYVSTYEELKARVLNPERDSGYRNYQAAWAWNVGVQERATLRNEHKLDNSAESPAEIVETILRLVEAGLG
jgi:broad-specificity NMP kinase